MNTMGGRLVEMQKVSLQGGRFWHSTQILFAACRDGGVPLSFNFWEGGYLWALRGCFLYQDSEKNSRYKYFIKKFL